MLSKAPKMTRAHYIFIADIIAPQVAWPTQLVEIANELKATNPKFNKERFLNRANKAWEAARDVDKIDDEVPYERLQ